MGKIYKKNEYNVYDDYAEILVTSPKYGEFKVLIDLDDIEKCKEKHWGVSKAYISKNNDFYIGSDHNSLLIHRFLMDYDGKDVVDHINGNPMDNRKINLRVRTMTENRRNNKTYVNNTSGYRGVVWYRFLNPPRWMVHITVDSIKKTIGYYHDLEDAIKARKDAEEKYFGEFNRK